MLTINKLNNRGSVKESPKNFLLTIEVFKAVPVSALQQVERNMNERKYARHESIFMEDDPAESVWFVKEGYVKEVHHTHDGRSLTLCMVGPGGMFGAGSLGGGNYGCQGLAASDATVVFFPIGVFYAFMASYPTMARAVITQISNLLRHSKERHSFAQESSEKRILHVIVDLAGQFGHTIPLTRKEIAGLAGTAVETTIRTFSRLETLGLVALGHGKFTIRNMNDLMERIGEF